MFFIVQPTIINYNIKKKKSGEGMINDFSDEIFKYLIENINFLL